MRSGGRSYWKSETSIEEIIGFEGRLQDEVRSDRRSPVRQSGGRAGTPGSPQALHILTF
jgi:hypothetical protein